ARATAPRRRMRHELRTDDPGHGGGHGRHPGLDLRPGRPHRLSTAPAAGPRFRAGDRAERDHRAAGDRAARGRAGDHLAQPTAGGGYRRGGPVRADAPPVAYDRGGDGRVPGLEVRRRGLDFAAKPRGTRRSRVSLCRSSLCGETSVDMQIEFAEVPFEERTVRLEYSWLNAQQRDAPLIVFLHEAL